MSFDPGHKGSAGLPRKKYMYQYDFESMGEEPSRFREYEEYFEQPKGKRAARKQVQAKRKRQRAEFY